MGEKFAIRYVIIGIVLMMLGSPLYFLSTSWLEYLGMILAVVGGGMVVVTIVRGYLP